MASQKTRRRSRKGRSAGRGNGATTSPQAGAVQSPGPTGARGRVTPKVSPRAAPAQTRRQQREERERIALRESALASRRLGTHGERPKSIFDPVPVAEFAIFAGIVAVIIGLINHGGLALTVGAIVCALGVMEFSAREHFTGFRSHTTLLAAVPAVLIEILLATFVGVPTKKILLLAPVVPVFALSFWLLRRSFATARHARVVKPPAV